MIIQFSIDGNDYEISNLTIFDYYYVLDEIALNPYAGLSVVSYLSGCPIEDLRNLETEDFLGLWEITQEFIKYSANPEGGIPKVLKHEGIKYHLINTENMTIGEFADLDVLVTSGSNKRIHEILAILYRPMVNGEIEEYDTKTYKIRAESFKTLSIQEGTKALNFFLDLGTQYLSNTKVYLREILKTEDLDQETEQVLKTTLRQLQELGTRLSQPLPTKTFWNLNELRNWELRLHSISLSISKTKPEKNNMNYKKLLKNINLN